MQLGELSDLEHSYKQTKIREEQKYKCGIKAQICLKMVYMRYIFLFLKKANAAKLVHIKTTQQLVEFPLKE